MTVSPIVCLVLNMTPVTALGCVLHSPSHLILSSPRRESCYSDVKAQYLTERHPRKCLHSFPCIERSRVIAGPSANEHTSSRQVLLEEWAVHKLRCILPRKWCCHNKSILTSFVPKPVLLATIAVEKFTQGFPLWLLCTHFSIKEGAETCARTGASCDSTSDSALAPEAVWVAHGRRE